MLAVRAQTEELMDGDDLSAETYAHVVRDLARVNSVTLARRPTLAFLDKVRRAHPGQPLRVLDVGFGDGDMLRAIERWGRARRIETLTLTGIDLNPRSAPAASSGTAADSRIVYRTGDYSALIGDFDVVISSLVAHHMTLTELCDFLRFMDANARYGWFINDLHRNGLAWLGFPLLAALMRWHPIVRHDGQVSIGRSYRAPEWTPILREANVTNARVFRQFPFRLCVECHR